MQRENIYWDIVLKTINDIAPCLKGNKLYRLAVADGLLLMQLHLP
jgi:hypothetical protein